MKKRTISFGIAFFLGFSFWVAGSGLLSRALALPPSGGGSDSVGSLMNPHPGYAIEWWYLTGRLHVPGEPGADGFEGTFFRFETGYRHPGGLPASPWEPKTILSFHGAFTDPSRPLFRWTQSMGRTFRQSSVLHSDPLRVSLEGNRLVFHSNPRDARRFSLHLLEQVKDKVLDLTLTGEGRPLWESETGKLVTGPGPEDWAWYLSYPALSVSGRIGTVVHGAIVAWKTVRGVAWFDHEWTHAMLGQGQTGWIWMGGRIRGETALMAFEMQKNGHPDHFRGGTFKEKGSDPVWIGSGGIRFHVLSAWRSPHTGICYPRKIRITFPGQKKQFLIRPIATDQELGGTPSYWEGAVRILDPVSRQPLGEGYLELTGFSRLSPDACLHWAEDLSGRKP